jgi:hypothetical protein
VRKVLLIIYAITAILLTSCKSTAIIQSESELYQKYESVVSYLKTDQETVNFYEQKESNSELQFAVYDHPQPISFTNVVQGPWPESQDKLDSLDQVTVVVDSLLSTSAGELKGLQTLTTDTASPLTLYLSLAYENMVAAEIAYDRDFVRTGERTEYLELPGFRGCWMSYLFHFDVANRIESVDKVSWCD